MIDQHLSRATLLFQQSRYDLAEQELRRALAAEPELPMAHALLALCLVERKEYGPATDEAKQAVHQAPDLPFVHYALANVYFQRRRMKEAEAAISEAIRLDPEDADFYALLASVRLAQHRWSEALTTAEQGLQVDAEHVGCTNLRAIALVKLGRKAEAGTTIDAALAKDPENAVSHANQGWTLLHQREPKKALEHFREALRLDPELDWARQGIVEALKARNPIYAVMLRYFLWMASLTTRVRWGVIIGGYIGYLIVVDVAEDNPALAPWLTPVIILYVVFALMTWLAYPLFNLMLRFSRFGRLALSREQTVATNWVGGCLAAALIALACYFILDAMLGLVFAIIFGVLTIPLAAVFYCSPGWPRRLMAGYTLMMALIGLAPLIIAVAARVAVPHLIDVFLIGSMLSPWVANIVAHVQPKL